MNIRQVKIKAIVVQSLNRVWLFATLWTAAHQASLSFTLSQSLLKFMSIVSVMPSNHLILCRPLLLLPSIFASIKVFSSELALPIRWPKYWSFSWVSVLPMNIQGLFPLGLTGLISLQSKKSIIQHHSLKAFILHLSAFFMVQLSHPFMTTVKNIALTIRPFLGKVMFLFFNTLTIKSRGITFPTCNIWVWESSERWWRTGKPGMLQPMGLQRVRHDWATGQQQDLLQLFFQEASVF